jgi:hypothetical protein
MAEGKKAPSWLPGRHMPQNSEYLLSHSGPQYQHKCPREALGIDVPKAVRKGRKE